MRRKKNRKDKSNLIIITLSLLIVILIFVGVIFFVDKYNKEQLALNNIDSTNEDKIEKEPVAEIPVKETPVEVKPEELPVEVPDQPIVTKNGKYNYGNYSLEESTVPSDKLNFWFGRNKNLARPVGALPDETFKKYNSYYIGPNKNVIYLTFDEGLNNTQASKNLDTLKKHGIKGTFFLTKGFIEANPDIVKRMVNEGHVAGNHTWNHKDMSSMALNSPEDFIRELSSTEDIFKDTTGRSMDKVFRFPEGTFSERALDFVNKMGYRSIFWSFAYKDWDPNWNTREEALSWMKGYYHPGAIYLIHGANIANAEALDEFITFMKGQGYTFDVPTNI